MEEQSLHNIIRVLPGERMVIAGKTGSGKTTFAERIIKPLPNLFVIDSKAELEIEGARVIEKPQDLSGIRQGSNEPIIFAPTPEYDEPYVYDVVLRFVYERKRTTLLIDELFAVYEPHKQNRWLKACLTRGRSREITTIAGTQRPRNIPLEILSESEHVVIYALDLPDDRKRMAEVCGDLKALKKPPERFAFWYKYVYNDDPLQAYKIDL